MKNSLTQCMAIIPARSGSKGVPDKNIRSLTGHPLLAWSIAAAKLSKRIDRIIVSTDSEHYASIAKMYGAEVPFLRPVDFASDTSLDKDFMLHALHWFSENEKTIPELLVLLRPTTPFRNPICIDEAIELFCKSEATSLRSAHEASESPAKWFKQVGGYFEGLMGNNWLDLPRQKCPLAYVPNGYVDIFSSQRILSGEDIHFPKMLAYISPVGYEVDTLDDMVYLEFLAEKGQILLPWLNAQTHVQR